MRTVCILQSQQAQNETGGKIKAGCAKLVPDNHRGFYMEYPHPQPRFQPYIELRNVHVGRHTNSPTHIEVSRATFDLYRRRVYRKYVVKRASRRGKQDIEPRWKLVQWSVAASRCRQKEMISRISGSGRQTPQGDEAPVPWDGSWWTGKGLGVQNRPTSCSLESVML
jgi:hypothetical protein